MKPLLLACIALFAVRLSAQCANPWASFGPVPGTDNSVTAVANWDPDGPGPLPPRVAVAGPFGSAGGASVASVAAWDPQSAQWLGIGAGPGGPLLPSTLLPLPNGDLIVGGASPFAAGVSLLARWNGTAWVPFGGLTSPSPGVAALAQMPNGDLAVGGQFTTVGSLPMPYVGLWNGTSWSSLGGGMNGPVLHLTVLPNGDLLALGAFTVAGGVPANGVARWNGIAWSALGAGIQGSSAALGPQAQAAVVLPNGDLVVGGAFAQAGSVPASNLARWDGTTWSEHAGGIQGTGFADMGVRTLALLPNGDLIAGGFFQRAGGSPIPNLAVSNGFAWSPLGTGIPGGAVHALAVTAGGDLVAGGTFTVAGDVGAAHIAQWDGAAWSPLGYGTTPSGEVRSLLAMPDGSIVAGGVFAAVGTVAANHIARWEGTTWSTLAGGFGSDDGVNAIVRTQSGDLVAGGKNSVRRWNGTNWQTLASGFTWIQPRPEGVKALAELANGDLVVGGDFATIGFAQIQALARWDGTRWSMLGSQSPGVIHAMATLSNGDLVVGGGMWMPHPQANNIARWDGAAWSPLGAGLDDEVFAIRELPNGDLIVGGRFATAGGQPANHVARWNGTAWSPIGAGVPFLVHTFHVLPNGDLLAAGSPWVSGGTVQQGIARWDGTTWTWLGRDLPPVGRGLLAMAALPTGEVLVGGNTYLANGQPSQNLAYLTTTCPASVQTFGSGCASSSGTVELHATTLPWLGSTFHSRATGLPANSVALVAYGLQSAALPLSAVVTPAGAGCQLLQTLDLLSLAFPSAGAVDMSANVPDLPALLGITAYHQVGVVEFASNTVLEVTTSNGLALGLGRF